MFRSFAKAFLPNRLDWMLNGAKKRGGSRILLGWNRGLGDIALGLYAIVFRIRELIPNAKITFLIRENLKEGFSMLEGVETIVAPSWKRGVPESVTETLIEMGIDPQGYDLIIEKPSPTDWVYWQRGKLVPKLQWDAKHDPLWKKFGLSDECYYVGVQPHAETGYGTWRNWPKERWEELFSRCGHNTRFLLFGFGNEWKFDFPNVIDLRGKTTLFELLSIIKNRCRAVIFPDSGLSSMTYYLDVNFPMLFISLWADPNHGILKQNVPSPNSLLVHAPLIGEKRDLSSVTVDAVMQRLFPEPLTSCVRVEEVVVREPQNSGCIILAGGQGTRFHAEGPKGLFTIHRKSLFQWICEKAPLDMPIAVMTSPLNAQETIAYFEKNQFFGRDIHFFAQEMQPLLDEEKRPIETRGPNGNGSVFRSFVGAGLAKLFAEKGVEVVTIVPVDNPLADPADAALLSFAKQTKADVVVKCIERKAEEISLGVVGKRNGKIEIIEYTEIAPEEMQRYRFANSGLFAFRLSFIEKMGGVDLPVHWVRKKMQIGAKSIWIWKGEHFIFDALPYAARVEALLAPRESCYASLKTKECLEEVEKRLEVQ